MRACVEPVSQSQCNIEKCPLNSQDKHIINELFVSSLSAYIFSEGSLQSSAAAAVVVVVVVVWFSVSVISGDGFCLISSRTCFP